MYIVVVVGTDGLTIYWLPIGTAFVIDEYGGDENLKIALIAWMIINKNLRGGKGVKTKAPLE